MPGTDRDMIPYLPRQYIGTLVLAVRFDGIVCTVFILEDGNSPAKNSVGLHWPGVMLLHCRNRNIFSIGLHMVSCRNMLSSGVPSDAGRNLQRDRATLAGPAQPYLPETALILPFFIAFSNTTW
jgi:hypothetical protein